MVDFESIFGSLMIMASKNQYENTLDEMWKIYMKNPAQIVNYKKQIGIIKEAGLKVFRNSNGQHKIMNLKE